jgi:hypothetical protein
MAKRSFWALFWANLKANPVVKFVVAYPLALLVAVVVVVGGFALMRIGVADPNIGGILKWLFSKPGAKKSVVAAANSIPKDRVDDDGNPIPIGTADKNGWTQWEVQEYQPPPNPLRDKSVITVSTIEGKPVEVALPEGIKDTDVDQVIEVKPEVFVVKTKNESKVHAKDLLDRLPKPKGAQ